MGLKEVLYSSLVPEMIWEKFQEKRMLGSAKTKLTSPFFVHLSESRKPLFRSGIECSLSETCCWALPPPAAHHHPPQLRLTSAQWHRLLSSFFRSVILSHLAIVPKLSLPWISSKFDIFSVDTSKKNNPRYIFLETCLFTSNTRGTMQKNWFTNKCYTRCFREPRQKTCEWKCLKRGWAITSDGSFPCSGQLE